MQNKRKKERKKERKKQAKKKKEKKYICSFLSFISVVFNCHLSTCCQFDYLVEWTAKQFFVCFLLLLFVAPFRDPPFTTTFCQTGWPTRLSIWLKLNKLCVRVVNEEASCRASKDNVDGFGTKRPPKEIGKYMSLSLKWLNYFSDPEPSKFSPLIKIRYLHKTNSSTRIWIQAAIKDCVFINVVCWLLWQDLLFCWDYVKTFVKEDLFLWKNNFFLVTQWTFEERNGSLSIAG